LSTNKLFKGETLTVTAPANKSSGDPVLIGSGIFGIAVDDATSGNDMAIETEGMFTLPKAGATAFTAGDVAYYNDGTGKITATNTDLPVGKVYETCAGGGELTCKVILEPVSAVGADITAHLGDTADAHDASAISVLDSANRFTGTDVEAALAELAGASRTTETVKGNAADIALLKDKYTIKWDGTSGTSYIVPTGCTAGATFTIGDVIESVTMTIKIAGTVEAPPVIGTDIAATFQDDGGNAKIQQLSVADWSANAFYATVRPI